METIEDIGLTRTSVKTANHSRYCESKQHLEQAGFVETAHHRLLIKTPFYRQLSIRNGKGADFSTEVNLTRAQVFESWQRQFVIGA